MSNDEEYSNIYRLLQEYNFEIDITTHRAVICCVCGNLLKNAQNGSCGCRFCFECFKSYLSSEAKYCPGKNGRCGEHMIGIALSLKSDRIANKEVSMVIVKCPIGVCEFRARLVDIDEHIAHHLKSTTLSDEESVIDAIKGDISMLRELFVDHKKDMVLEINELKRRNELYKEEIGRLEEMIKKKEKSEMVTEYTVKEESQNDSDIDWELKLFEDETLDEQESENDFETIEGKMSIEQILRFTGDLKGQDMERCNKKEKLLQDTDINATADKVMTGQYDHSLGGEVQINDVKGFIEKEVRKQLIDMLATFLSQEDVDKSRSTKGSPGLTEQQVGTPIPTINVEMTNESSCPSLFPGVGDTSDTNMTCKTSRRRLKRDLPSLPKTTSTPTESKELGQKENVFGSSETLNRANTTQNELTRDLENGMKSKLSSHTPTSSVTATAAAKSKYTATNTIVGAPAIATKIPFTHKSKSTSNEHYLSFPTPKTNIKNATIDHEGRETPKTLKDVTRKRRKSRLKAFSTLQSKYKSIKVPKFGQPKDCPLLEVQLKENGTERITSLVKEKQKNISKKSLDYYYTSAKDLHDHYQRGSTKIIWQGLFNNRNIGGSVLKEPAMHWSGDSTIFEMKIDNFSEKIYESQQNSMLSTSIHSDPFYSDKKGYKLCLRVDLSSVGLGSHPYLGVFFCLLPGPFDNMLNWPMLTEVTISLVDQFTKQPYTSRTFDFDSAPEKWKYVFDPPSVNSFNWFGSPQFIHFDFLCRNPSLLQNDSVVLRCSTGPV